jgi:hypothetical protein
MTVRRREPPILPSDVRRLGGEISIAPARDRTDGTDFFRVRYISKGGDLEWVSPPIPSIDRASSSADCLASFLGATVRK